MEFNVSREFLEVNQGSPKVLIKQFVTGETVELVCNTIEWNIMNLAYALGEGTTASTAAKDTYNFGADPDTTELAVHVQHSMPSGNTVSIYMWRAQPSGEWNMSMAQDELHTFPFSFKALQATTAWDGSTLAVGEQLFRVVKFKQ